jgi:hypothetical protein
VLLDSSTFSQQADGGQIQLISGGDLRLLGSDGPVGVSIGAFSASGSGGKAGNISLQAAGRLETGAGTQIGTSATGTGAGGQILLSGQQIALRGSTLNSSSFGSGDAGGIRVQASDSLSLERSIIATNAISDGAAGTIDLQAGAIRISDRSSVLAIAAEQSSGRNGSIELGAQGLIQIDGDSYLSISNSAQVPHPGELQPTRLRLQAANILLDHAVIAAEALGNTNASAVELLAGDSLLLRRSGVSTAARDGNGGPLRAEAGRLLWLKDSALTTSVFGETGDGGDIAIKTGLLFLDGGFIQANTAAANASGGDVSIETGALVASDNRVVIGGDAPLVFDPLKPLNVIQAAAPNGVSGAVAVANTLDIAGSLALLDRSLLDPGGLGRSPCDRRGGSSLAQAGRGGLPPALLAPLGAPQPPAPPPPVGAAAAAGLWGDCR